MGIDGLTPCIPECQVARLWERGKEGTRESLLATENPYSSLADVLGLTSINFRGVQGLQGIPELLEILCNTVYMCLEAFVTYFH